MRAISFSPTSRRHGAPRQQVLGAVDLGRLRQDRRAAVAHQQVDRRAERRVGGDAGIAVRAAALQADASDVRRRHRLRACTALACGSISLTMLDAVRDRLRACRRCPGW